MGARVQHFKQAETNAGEKYLRVDKARADIKKSAGSTLGDGTGQRIARGPPAKFRVRNQAVSKSGPAVVPPHAKARIIATRMTGRSAVQNCGDSSRARN